MRVKRANENLFSWFVVGVLLAAILFTVFMVIPASAQTSGGAPFAPQWNTRLLIGVERAAARQYMAGRCLGMGWQIDPSQTDEYTITCTHAADATGNFWLTPNQGMGRRPMWVFQLQMSEFNPGLLVAANLQLQTYTWTGAPGAPQPIGRDERATVEAVLRDLAAMCTEPCGSN